MKYILNILIFSQFCLNAQPIKTPMNKWVNKGGLYDTEVTKKIIIFEQYFDDSIKVLVDKKVIINKLIKTEKRIQASSEFISFDSIKNQKVYFFINNKWYYFCLRKRYKYYYFNQFEDKIGIQYSNYQREYY